MSDAAVPVQFATNVQTALTDAGWTKDVSFRAFEDKAQDGVRRKMYRYCYKGTKQDGWVSSYTGGGDFFTRMESVARAPSFEEADALCWLREQKSVAITPVTAEAISE